MKICLDALHLLEIQKNKFLAVNTTKGTVNSSPHVVKSCSHASSAMIKLAIIQWTGSILKLLL